MTRRYKPRRKYRYTRYLSMAELAEKLGINSADPDRDARAMLLRIQNRVGRPLMWKHGEHQQSRWYTTEATLIRYAPELLDVEPEALEAAKELRDLVTTKMDDMNAQLDELEGECRRAFAVLKRRVESLEVAIPSRAITAEHLRARSGDSESEPKPAKRRRYKRRRARRKASTKATPEQQAPMTAAGAA